MKYNSNALEESNQNPVQNTIVGKDMSPAEESKRIVMNHLGSFRDNNIEAVMADYTNESLLVTQAATYSGTEQIRAFFAELVIHFPTQTSTFELDKLIIHDELVYIVWHANTPSLDVPLGSDTFIIKNGKIYQQTFVGELNFINK